MRGSRMGLIAAMVAASAVGPAATYVASKAVDYDDGFLPLRQSPGRKVGGSRGKRHANPAKKHPNRLHISRRTRRKHRRAA